MEANLYARQVLMMKRDYISVKEFATLAGIKHQSVYKRLQDPENALYPYMKVIGKKKCIARVALSEVFGIPMAEPEVQPDCNLVAQAVQSDSAETVEFLKAEIERLHSQMTEQFRVIERLQDELKEKDERYFKLLERSQELQRGEQELHAATQERLPEPEEPCRAEPVTVEATAADTAPVDPAEPQQPKAQQAQPKPQPIKPNNPLPKQKKTKQKRSHFERLKNIFGSR